MQIIQSIKENITLEKDWNSIMSAVKDINELNYLDLWNKNNIDRFNLTSAIDRVDINEAYDLIIMFIKWYNLEVKKYESNRN